MVLITKEDTRLGNIKRYALVPDNEVFMLVPENIRKCCCFIYIDIFGKRVLQGTGFFIEEKIADDGVENIRYVYLVTAKHVIQPFKAEGRTIGIRINTMDGGAQDIDLPSDAWIEHPTDKSIDAIIMRIQTIEGFDVGTIPTEIIMDEKTIKKEGFGIGHEVNVIGLFHKHPGGNKNLPILRTGNIAMMNEEPIKIEIESGQCHYSDLYLIELRSIGGLSGSPVFVHKNVVKEGKSHHSLFWMGMIHGHWPLSEDESIDRVRDIEGEPLNTGIGMVVPATKIMEITQHEGLMKEKEKDRKKFNMRNIPTPDSAITKDEFHRILDKASQPIKRKTESDSEKSET